MRAGHETERAAREVRDRDADARRDRRIVRELREGDPRVRDEPPDGQLLGRRLLRRGLADRSEERSRQQTGDQPPHRS